MQHFILPHPLESDKVRIFERETLRQMTKVLRFRKGDKCVLMDGQGTKAKATVQELHSKVAVLSIQERETSEAPVRRVRLFCSISKKPASFEFILQKATEMRVTDLIPLVTQRCQVKDVRKKERLEAIIKEACEQCEQPFLPELHEVVSLEVLLRNPPSGLLLAGDARRYDALLKELPLKDQEDINLVIGPEGGLTEEELEAIHQAGGTLFLLGDSVLRMETAALASLAVIQYAKFT